MSDAAEKINQLLKQIEYLTDQNNRRVGLICTDLAFKISKAVENNDFDKINTLINLRKLLESIYPNDILAEIALYSMQEKPYD